MITPHSELRTSREFQELILPAHPLVHWTEGGKARSARWRSESGAPPARRVVIANDHITADDAYGLACQGTALLWRGDLPDPRPAVVLVGRLAAPPPPPHA